MRLVLTRKTLVLGVLAALCTGLACTAGTPPYQERPDPKLEETWAEYLELPDHKAIAVAGSLRGSRWVTAVAGRQSSADAARDLALAECQKRRTTFRVQAQCVPYAQGEKIVWRGY